jgi:glycosyltransferase involved in cell wall biosynthesis/SAM-dependent methyltransferase
MARILTLTNWFPPHSRGGYEVLCDDVTTGLQARGHQVEVLCGDELLPNVDDARERSFDVHRRLKMYWRDGEPWTPSVREQIEIERINQRELQMAIGRFNPKVISVWHMGALSLNLLTTIRRRRIPMVYGICDDWLTYGLELDPWSRKWYRNPIRRFAGRSVERLTGVPGVVTDLGSTGCFCFISAATRDHARMGSPWSYPVAPVVHAGIDRTLYPAPDEFELRPWKWKLLFMGRLDSRKGTDTLLRAMVRLPDVAKLSIVGRGEPSEVARLERLAEDLGIADRVSFAWATRSETVGFYLDHDCLVFPSEWSEPFGLVPLEAMACGTPVVATGDGGSAEFLVDGANCLLFPAADAAGLAKAVMQLADDAPLRAQLRNQGWMTAEQLDVRHMTDAYEKCHVAAAEGKLNELRIAEPERVNIESNPLGRHRASVDHLLGPQRDMNAVPTSGDVKALYQDLGRDWWEGYRPDGDPIPVLSAPETTPIVVGRFHGVRGLVLDAGCGPNPAASIGLARSSERKVVAVDIGIGMVRVAVAEAKRQGVDILGVVADVEHLPFRDAGFSGVVCDDTIEHLPNDRAGVAELARVSTPDATVVLATPNRYNALVLKSRLRDRWRGVRRPLEHYFVSNSHLREYTWSEFESLVAPDLEIVARVSVGWEQSRKRRLASRFLFGPLRKVSQMVVVEARPRQAH